MDDLAGAARVSPRSPAPRQVDVLLVGGGVASVRCARTLRRRGFRGSILLVGDEGTLPYNRPPLSKELLRGEVAAELIQAEPPSWYERQGVELRSGVPVAQLDPGDQLVRLADGTRLRYGSCLLATGAEARPASIPGAEHARLLRTTADATEIRHAAERAGPQAPAVVIGGGFIGVEVAASLAAHRLRVTLLELSPQLWAGAFGETLSAWAVEVLRGAGVEVRCQTLVTAVEPGSVRIGSERVAAALVVAGVGVRPLTGLAEAAGLPIGDGIEVGEDRSAASGVFAAGDVASVPHPALDGARLRVEHWHAAREGGEAAAIGILGEPVPAPRPPWIYSEFAGQLIDVVGWVPRASEERVMGDIGSGRFAVAAVQDGRVVQVAIVNGYLPVEAARAFLESRPMASALTELAPA